MPGLDAPSHWVIIAVVVLVLFGYKKLPEMSRSLGRSLRIFKTEMKGLSDDDNARDAGTATTPVAEAPAPPLAGAPPAPVAVPPAPTAGPQAPGVDAPAPVYPAQNGQSAQTPAASHQLGA